MISRQSFGYDTTYPDRLTSCGGASVSYDAMGCPTKYDGYTVSWTRGKLAKLRDGSKTTGFHNYYYDYNALGQRTSRSYTFSLPTTGTAAVIVGMVIGYGQTFKYDQSGRLIYESRSSKHYRELDSTDSIVYLYDENNIIGVVYTVDGSANTYYFQRNLFGDVIGIYDTSGTKVGGYAYDAWGNCTVTLNAKSIVTRNPIRYRGYYYDEDTKLYYLNARYYCPEWHRFFSPDDTGYLDPESVNGLNLYAYCGNDPVNYADPSGNNPEWWQWLLSGVTTALGVALCFVPGAQVFGVGLIAAGASGLISSTMDAVGLDAKTAGLISSGLSIIAGIALCFTPFAGIGAGLVGQGVGGIAGGFISEALGGSFELGATIGGIAGSIAGGIAYREITSYRLARMSAYDKGLMGERYVKALYGNKVYKPTTGGNRPDLLFKNGSALIEVKNVASQGLTRQLNRYLNMGRAKNILYVRLGTKVSSTLKASSYVLKYFPW